MKHFTQDSPIRFVAASALLFALAVKAPASIMVYEAAVGVPTNANWTRTDGGPFPGGNTETISGGNLVVTDNNSTFAPFTYRFNASLSSEVNWQIRARVGVGTNYAGLGNSLHSIYHQLVNDAGGAVPAGAFGFGILYNSAASETRVFLSGSNNDGTFVNVAGNPLLDVVVTKTTGGNPGGRGDDPVLLQVYKDNVLQGSVSTTLAGGFGFGPPAFVQFGNQSGAPSGTFVLNWASFGINELAPVIPEPSTAALCLAASVLGIARWRNRGN